MFKETHPILGTRNIRRAIEFYTRQLGFALAFGDNAAGTSAAGTSAAGTSAAGDGAEPPNYVGFRRDAVELHMQFQFEHEMSTIRLRLLVDDPDALFDEYRKRGVECSPHGIRDTPWGTREFALYDLDRNALTFYRDLSRAELERPSAESTSVGEAGSGGAAL
jgi:catechol 2,3-dioxygenase-like lactoylglutathione lyase family enzyme